MMHIRVICFLLVILLNQVQLGIGVRNYVRVNIDGTPLIPPQTPIFPTPSQPSTCVSPPLTVPIPVNPNGNAFPATVTCTYQQRISNTFFTGPVSIYSFAITKTFATETCLQTVLSVSMSTTASGGVLSTTFASNNNQLWHSMGTLTVAATTYNIGDQISTVGAATPFLYDPLQGDLLVRYDTISPAVPNLQNCYFNADYTGYPTSSDRVLSRACGTIVAENYYDSGGLILDLCFSPSSGVTE
jgi:hypothetical protein